MPGAQLFNCHETRKFIERAAEHYATSAPALVDWLDEVYIALNEKPASVSVWEIMQLDQLMVDGTWEHPNYAQNRWYKVRAALGKERGVLSY